MNAVDVASTHGHFVKLTANTLRWTFSQTRKKFEILTHSGNLWKYKWNQTRSTLYKERDFWKIYLRTGQSGCELKIAETRFGHKTIRSPVFPFFLFFFFSKLVEGIYIIYIMKIIWRDLKKKFVWAVSEIHKNLLKVQILNEVALTQVVEKRVSFQGRKKENAPKFPSNEIWY